jgi:uncharacterized protein (UPF0261 family)
MERRILIIATLDTKNRETFYLRDQLKALGCRAMLMDLSMGGESDKRADIPPEAVAREGGVDIEAIRSSRDRNFITKTMTKGAIKTAKRLWEKGEIQGVMGLGGATLSMMATGIMRALPFGVPKLMISSAAALPGLSTRYIGTGDIALMHTVIELSGLSPHLKNVLNRAARAMAGMAAEPTFSSRPAKDTGKKQIALSMFGPCDRSAHQIQEGLEGAGFQVIGFHAAGISDRAMEEMIGEGYFDGVVDLAPGGVGEELLGGMRAAGPNRMEAAGKAGIPQIIAPSGVNFMSPNRKNYKPDYHARRKYDLDKDRTWLRLTPEELRMVAGVMARKLNQAKGPVIFMVPTRGWSSADLPGSPAFDPVEDQVFVETLKAHLKPEITVRTVEAHLEDPVFGEAVIAACLEVFK